MQKKLFSLSKLIQLEFELIYFFIILLFFLTGCADKTNKNTMIKKAKPVPNNYKNISTNNFIHHQDTLYLNQLKFSGFLYGLYPSGDTDFIKSYLNGLEEGSQISWYNNKQLAEKRLYVDGKKEGLQEGWWPNGKQKFLFTTAQDAFVGELKEWNQVGLLFKDFNYVNGQEEGSEKMWWDDGSVRANYVIKDGKRYGLLGMKICINTYDSIYKK